MRRFWHHLETWQKVMLVIAALLILVGIPVAIVGMVIGETWTAWISLAMSVFAIVTFALTMRHLWRQSDPARPRQR